MTPEQTLLEALKFYANPRTWQIIVTETDLDVPAFLRQKPPPVLDDLGKTARIAITAYEKAKDPPPKQGE